MKVASSAHFSVWPIFWWFLGILFDPEAVFELHFLNNPEGTLFHSPHIEHGSSV
jgi:hypothetical protein